MASPASPVQHHLDEPAPGARAYRQRIPIRGWVFAGERHGDLARIVARAGDRVVGEAVHLHRRTDVNAALGLPPDVPTGFRLLGVLERAPAAPETVPLTLTAEFHYGPPESLRGFTVEVLPRDFTDGPYGTLCDPRSTGLLGREHLYSTGLPSPAASPDCVRLLADYLPPGTSVLDVGCGVGAYAEPLRGQGCTWCGCDVSRDFVAAVARRGLPVRLIRRGWWPGSAGRLPARDGEFDAAIAIEVLEHVRRPEAFVAEVARVARRHAVFSVPNLEPLPFLFDRQVAPWHLLEGDHRNFFNRFNLAALLRRHFARVDVLDYGPQVLRSPDGLEMPYHLAAVCSHEPTRGRR